MSAIQCECGLLYASDVRGDVRLHRKEHDEWLNGVKSAATGAEVARHGEYCVTIVPPTAPLALRKVAERVGRFGNQETRYDFRVYNIHSGDDGVHALIAWRGDRAIGILVLDQRDRERYIRWEDAQPAGGFELTEARTPRWSVAFAWVHHAHRRRGVASALVQAAARFGGVAITELGWLTQFTDAGEALLRRHCPDGFWLI